MTRIKRDTAHSPWLDLVGAIAAGHGDPLGVSPILPLDPTLSSESLRPTTLGDCCDDEFDGVRLDLVTRRGFWQRAPTTLRPAPACPQGPSSPLTPEERALIDPTMPDARSRCPAGLTHDPSPLRLDPDRRVRFKGDPSRFPWRAFTRIRAGSFQQSGVFIGPRHVLTCAHTLWNCFPGLGCGFMGLPIRVYFGAAGHWRFATDLFIPSRWWAKGRRAGHNWDYALLVVAADGHDSPGYFTLTPGSDRELTFTTSYGFPSPVLTCKDAPRPAPQCAPWGPCGDNLYGMAMTAYSRRRTYFAGPFNSQNGQSGAPFYGCVRGQRRVFGILSGSLPTADGEYGQRALAKRFGPESTAQIAWWIANSPRDRAR